MFNDSLVHMKYKVTSVLHCLIVINESIKTSPYYQQPTQYPQFNGLALRQLFLYPVMLNKNNH